MHEMTPANPGDSKQWPGLGNLRHLPATWNKRRLEFYGNAKPAESVCFFGDSITEGWRERLYDWFQPLVTSNRGISGDTTRGMLFRLNDDVLWPLRPRALVIMVGVNDLDVKSEPSAISSNIEQMVRMSKDFLLPESIYVCEILPHRDQETRPELRIKETNDNIRAMCSSYKCNFVPAYQMFVKPWNGEFEQKYFEDAVHPNHDGYSTLCNCIRTAFAETGLL